MAVYCSQFLFCVDFKIWWCLQLFIALFVLPTIAVRKYILFENSIICPIRYSLICLPFSFCLAQLQGISFFFWGMLQFVVILWLIESFYLIFKTSDIYETWKSYIKHSFILSTLPVFLYYVYLDIYRTPIDNFLNWTPFGIVRQGKIELENSVVFLYPISLYILIKIKQKFILITSQAH